MTAEDRWGRPERGKSRCGSSTGGGGVSSGRGLAPDLGDAPRTRHGPIDRVACGVIHRPPDRFRTLLRAPGVRRVFRLHLECLG